MQNGMLTLAQISAASEDSKRVGILDAIRTMRVNAAAEMENAFTNRPIFGLGFASVNVSPNCSNLELLAQILTVEEPFAGVKWPSKLCP